MNAFRSVPVVCATLGALCSLVIGCGPSEDEGDESDLGADGGTSASGGAESTGGAGSGANGSTGGSGTGTGGATAGSGGEAAADDHDPIGRVQVLRFLSRSPTNASTSVQVSFDRVEQAAWDALTPSTEDRCTTTEFGDCQVNVCTPLPDSIPGTEALSTERLHAGTVTITAALPDDFSAVGVPDGQDNNYINQLNEHIVGDESLTISAEGGTVPSFSTEIQVPFSPYLLTPAAPAAELGEVVTVPLSKAADAVITWDARGNEEEFQVVTSSATDNLPRLSCRFDASSGVGVIEQEALALVASGSTFSLFSTATQYLETSQGEVLILVGIEIQSSDSMGYPQFVVE